VVADGYSPTYGARNIKRTIQKLVEDPLSEMVLRNLLPHKAVLMTLDKDGALAVDWKASNLDPAAFARGRGRCKVAPARRRQTGRATIQPGSKALLGPVHFCTLLMLLLSAYTAHAITLAEIPRETRDRLPQFLFYS
jgi:hypothetical protein